MLTWVIQITIISFVLIFLIHHLINFLKSTLTVPKIKDLVNAPTQKYENIYNIINNSEKSTSNTNLENEYSLIELLPKNEETDMKNELKNFLKSQLDNSINSESGNRNGTDISSLDYMSSSSSNAYSNY
jgi:hypothetical protein